MNWRIRSSTLSRVQIRSHRYLVGKPGRVGWDRRVARAAEAPLVERQKAGSGPGEPCRHVHQFRVDGEVSEAAPVGEERLPSCRG